MSEKRGSVIDRRTGRDRRRDNLGYFLNKGIERRSGEERRSQIERRSDWLRVSECYSVCPWEKRSFIGYFKRER